MTIRSKLGFLGPHKVDFGSNLVKVVKISEKLGFDVKLQKMLFVRVLTSFDLRSNLGLTKGILVILAERGTSGASMLEQFASCHSIYSHGPMERK